MGSNCNGQLGIGSISIKYSDSPQILTSLTHLNCLLLATGFEHSTALMGEFNVYI